MSSSDSSMGPASTPWIDSETARWHCSITTPYCPQQLLKRPSHDPRDLHLGDADAISDLVLGQALVEAHLQNAPLPLRERCVGCGSLYLDGLVAPLAASHRLDHRGRLGILAAAGCVERQSAARLVSLQRFPDILLGEVEPLGDLSRGRAASELFAQLPCRFLDGHRPLLERARKAESADPIAEVAAKLAEDRRRGVGHKRLAPLRVETIECLEEAQKRYLH